MKRVIVIGGGISGMSCAVRLAEQGVHVLLVSPAPSERAQSVMAAGGINAVLSQCDPGDSIACHVEDTLKGGRYIAGEEAVKGLCAHAPKIVEYLERIGTVFSVDANGRPARRAFGGQSYKRTCYCGASTGKQIVSALVMEVRRYEAAGLIERRTTCWFHSALIEGGTCHGALLFDQRSSRLVLETSCAVVMATGGQNALFGKTTGSTQCDGYAAGKLFMQGVELKNLEFIQYHPTTLETSQKRMLISEAARGEGGRLFFVRNGERVYFMEDKYGPRGNLMTRDVVSREIYATGEDVFLDVSFLGARTIDQRLPEVRDLCTKYRGIDISKEPIPVAPSVHFFMGGIAVHLNHETCVSNLFAVGECASMYHGANRLGGNSLLAALHSGMVAADEIASREYSPVAGGFADQLARETAALKSMANTNSSFPAVYIRDMIADTMKGCLGIVRSDEALERGVADIDYYLGVAAKMRYDNSVDAYANYSLEAILSLAKAVLVCARERKESRGAHARSDYPQEQEAFRAATIIAFDGGSYATRLDMEQAYES